MDMVCLATVNHLQSNVNHCHDRFINEVYSVDL
jgi:hypothetical protein